MRALICKAFGPLESLTVEDVPDPKPGPGQIIVGVRACAVNFPDVLIGQGKYQFKPTPPFSPGGEVAGVIEAVGQGVEGLRVGDRVTAFGPFGGLAEKLSTDPMHVVKMPDGLDFVTASCMTTAYGTTLHALRDRAQLKPGETLLVLGAAGGTGLSAVQIGKRMGARVVAAASTDDKLQTCKAHGADSTINYCKEDLKERVKSLTGGAGADVVYDPVGGPYTEQALRATGWNGRLLVIGFTAGDIPKVPTNLALLKGCSIVGVFWGMFMARHPDVGRAQLEELLRWAADGSLKIHVHGTYPLGRALDALVDMDRRRIQGKAVVVMGGATT
jgi:NADPH:quinone reductase